MAIKYTRDMDEAPVTRISERLGHRSPGRRGGLLSFHQGGGPGLILSVGFVIFALMLFQNAVDRMMADPTMAETALGTVIDKAESDPDALGDTHFLQLRLELDDGSAREVWVPTDAESFEAVSEGDQLEVEFRAQFRTGGIQVQRLRALPMPAEDEPE